MDKKGRREKRIRKRKRKKEYGKRIEVDKKGSIIYEFRNGLDDDDDSRVFGLDRRRGLCPRRSV